MLMLFYTLCFADINASVYWECSEAENNSTDDDIAFRTTLNNLLNSLAAEGADHNGFYKTTEGKRSNRVYGLVQCRGDISASDCANCTKQSITLASHDCSQSKNVKVWFNWCFLRYSDVGFFGVWDQTSVAKANDTNFDDPSVVSGGFSMMTELATTTSGLPLMFQTAVFDAGQSGKRYGMAQCNRDISRSDCGKCLNDQLMTFRTTVGNKRGWEIYGSSCCMWYHDFQFYSNISAPSGKFEKCYLFCLFYIFRGFFKTNYVFNDIYQKIET